MAYKSLKFLAQEWRERLDPNTEELIIEASFPSLRKGCLVLAEPVPGSEPPTVVYSCLSLTCTGQNHCELMTRMEPDGSIVHYCECVPDGNGGAASAKARKSRKKVN